MIGPVTSANAMQSEMRNSEPSNEFARLVSLVSDPCEVVKGIPRFVNSDEYASSFGLQWNFFRRTQLDSFTGLSISRDRLTRSDGGLPG